jgi:hypothetical protein
LNEKLQNHSFSNIWILISFLAKFRQFNKGCLGERWGQNKRKEIKAKRTNDNKNPDFWFSEAKLSVLHDWQCLTPGSAG